VTVTPGDVDAQIAEYVERPGSREGLEMQAAQSGISAPTCPDFVATSCSSSGSPTGSPGPRRPARAAPALYDQNAAQYDQVRSRHILVEEEAQRARC
jgi:hypothetical protein